VDSDSLASVKVLLVFPNALILRHWVGYWK